MGLCPFNDSSAGWFMIELYSNPISAACDQLMMATIFHYPLAANKLTKRNKLKEIDDMIRQLYCDDPGFRHVPPAICYC
jgi:hypothetical protein